MFKKITKFFKNDIETFEIDKREFYTRSITFGVLWMWVIFGLMGFFGLSELSEIPLVDIVFNKMFWNVTIRISTLFWGFVAFYYLLKRKEMTFKRMVFFLISFPLGFAILIGNLSMLISIETIFGKVGVYLYNFISVLAVFTIIYFKVGLKKRVKETKQTKKNEK